MKPTLKAMLEVVGVKMTPMPLKMLEGVFLAALHWRGKELWCGPFYVGRVFNNTRLTLDALEAEAHRQIRRWFEEEAQ